MNPERFSELALRISPLVDSEIARLRSLQKWKEVLPPWRTIWEIVRMITFRIESELQKWNQFIPEYHVPWMTQVLLKKWTTEKDLRLDTESQVLYENVPDMKIPISGIDIFDSAFSEIPDALIFRWFVKNMGQVCDVLYSVLNSQIKEWKDILIVSNHATWFNLPLITHCLHRIFGIPKEDIYTIVWPAITHGNFTLATILHFSNVLKTSPDTPKAEIGYIGIPEIRDRFLKELQRIISWKPNNWSRIFLLAPSGTTDLYQDGNILMQDPSKWTQTLIAMMLRRMKLSWFAVWVNDLSMIKPGHSRPNMFGGNVQVWAREISQGNWKEVLPWQILDQYGNPIGQWKDENLSN